MKIKRERTAEMQRNDFRSLIEKSADAVSRINTVLGSFPLSTTSFRDDQVMKNQRAIMEGISSRYLSTAISEMASRQDMGDVRNLAFTVPVKLTPFGKTLSMIPGESVAIDHEGVSGNAEGAVTIVLNAHDYSGFQFSRIKKEPSSVIIGAIPWLINKSEGKTSRGRLITRDAARNAHASEDIVVHSMSLEGTGIGEGDVLTLLETLFFSEEDPFAGKAPVPCAQPVYQALSRFRSDLRRAHRSTVVDANVEASVPYLEDATIDGMISLGTTLNRALPWGRIKVQDASMAASVAQQHSTLIATLLDETSALRHIAIGRNDMSVRDSRSTSFDSTQWYLGEFGKYHGAGFLEGVAAALARTHIGDSYRQTMRACYSILLVSRSAAHYAIDDIGAGARIGRFLETSPFQELTSIADFGNAIYGLFAPELLLNSV